MNLQTFTQAVAVAIPMGTLEVADQSNDWATSFVGISDSGFGKLRILYLQWEDQISWRVERLYRECGTVSDRGTGETLETAMRQLEIRMWAADWAWAAAQAAVE